ncbi:uncharacterized protein LOC129948917 [Eupeodes corollae]|uniref:uncharacterized protein LOC129948917 n=2 Tax=Eupeodes corollae TaxID=290404 RepID=UPI0024930ECD|nr:uncharacterized protein LOC129948917 [Eupeodes corollae]
MNIVKQKRGRAKGTITRVSTFSESVVDSTPIDMLEIQLKKLQEAWSEFVLQQNNLYEFYDQEGFLDPEPEYGEYETKYFEAFSKLSGSIRKHPDKDRDEASTINASVLQKSNSRQSVVLPKLVIPVFIGDYKDLPVFKDLFTGTIDCNVSLTGTQKFQYLKSFLGGEAATLLKHISCTEENYLEAWDKLEARYDKKHLIVQSFIKSFMALPSSNNLNLETLRKLTNGADEIVRGLNALQMNSRDPWLIYILVQKLDSETKQASCNARHHTLVHEPRITSTNKTTEQPSTQNPSNSAVTHHSLESTRNAHSSLESNVIKSTILPTAVVKVQDKFGSFQNIRILLDSGSQISFITEKALQRLGLPRKPSRIPIVGVASTSAGTTNGLISLKLHSRFNSNHIDIDCHIRNFMNQERLICSSEQIIFSTLFSKHQGAPNSLLTIFGWVIAGSYDRTPSSEAFVIKSFCTQLDYAKYFDLERFWRLEEIFYEQPLSIEEQRAEDDFIQTHSRHTDGRYMVNLPFKPNCKPTSESSSRIALNRLYSMEKRFVRDPELQKQYSSFLNEYISLGHMEEIPVKEINDSDSYYLPHHAVFKADSTKRALKQLALDSAETHPRASSVILNDFYVDDLVTGADTIEDLIALQKELVEVLSLAGFNLRKWTTNCWPLLISFPEDQRELSPIDFENSLTVKVLGLRWCPSGDCFSYKVNLDQSTSCTKRSILSEASRIFDPLGFLAPVVVAVKIFFQDLWRAGVGWDDQILQELSHRWITIREELHLLESIRIPRLMWTNKVNYEFHAFCDASLDAYAAVIYCRSENLDGTVSISLIAAKTKVAPIKVLSLPRLELCGALLLTRLVKKIKISLQIKHMQLFVWTDSSIVLHWLAAPPKKWSVFVGNRTSEIVSSIPVKSWNHVRSADNPADVPSRGIPPSQLESTDIWWNGPVWLKMNRSEWPKTQHDLQNVSSDQLEERNSNKVQVFVSQINENNILRQIINKSSDWIKSVRVVAYIFRYLKNRRLAPELRDLQALSTSELNHAKTCLIKASQYILFAAEIESLNKYKYLPSRSKLSSIAPFLDSENVLRVGGRIQNSELSFNEKHPIILCKSHPITKLIVEYTHKHYLHAGVSLMVSLLKQNYFILGSRNIVRKVVNDCIDCFKQRKSTSEQMMGNLPIERVRFSRPFSKVGCDYAGPITLRLARGRNPKFVKGYIALFVCFVTKGVHIELVGDLSSSAFILALDRFVSRRGKPTEIWSDNATNFHGAKRFLGEMHELLMDQQRNNIIADHLSKDAIDWKFIPPSAPHFGGLWEAGVKSVKKHITRVIGEHILTYEEMYTLLSKIECLLNSRPMWQTSDFEPIALTPSHFMIGEPYCAIPQPDLDFSKFSISSNWHLLQTLMQGFWKQWHKEYLTSLQNRPKWQKVQRDLQKNDMVLLKEPNLPPSKWILGRVIEVHPGADERIRVVTVRTKNGDYVRPIVKLAPLPFSERPESSRGG